MSLTPHAPGKRPLRVGYVLKRFPRLSETFILNEMLELERQGIEVHAFSLLRPPAEPRHALLEQLRASVTYLPRSRALERWEISCQRPAAESTKQSMVGAIEPAEDLFDHLFPGKSAEEAAVLGLQAMSLAMLASARRIDHLHAHFTSNATTVALLAARISAIPYSFTAHARDIYHTYVNGRVDAALRRRKIAEARFVVTVSDYNQRHLAALAGAATSSKIRRIYNGIDLGRFAPGERPVTAKPCRFLAVGRLVEKKGFTYLIEACRLLHAKGVPFRCELVGEGPLRDALLSQVRAAGLDEIVTLHGAMPQESLLELMHSSSVVVLPAIVTPSGDRDALPTVLLEGLAMGLPAVSTDVSGITEIVEHGSSGLVVPPEDAPALAQAMQQVAVDGALRSRLGANGRRRARERFDLVRNVNELRQCFERSAGGNSVVEMTTAREEQGHAHRVPVCG